MFGGTPEPPTGSDETQPKLADTTLLQFSEWLMVCYQISFHYVYASVNIVTETMYLYVCVYPHVRVFFTHVALVVKLIHVYMYMYRFSHG